jgi:predicted phosphodiesterase
VLKRVIVSACVVLFYLTANASAVLSDTTDDLTGIISAKGEYLPSEGAAKAFDNNSATKWLDFSPASSWIQYQYAFDKRSVVAEYTLTSANDFNQRDPKSWNLLGSNNGGASWVTLDTRTNELFTSYFQKRSFSFTNSTGYNIYRLEITQLRGGSPAPTCVQLAEIELIGTPPAPPVKATSPNPANNAVGVPITAALSWTAGSDAASHDVYLGTVLSDVNNAQRLLGDLNGNGTIDLNDMLLLAEYWLLDPAGTEPYAAVNTDNVVDFIDYALLAQDWMNSAGSVFKGNQDANSFNQGTLALSTTYYWRIDEVNGPNTVTGDVWSFITQSDKASNPSPANSVSNVAINATMSWSAGAGATSHDVYFGTANPPPSIGNRTAAAYTPGTLANSTTYYWRIDEVGGSGTITGDVWSFTTQSSVTANRRKGPYLIYPGVNTQMTVLWQVDVTAGCIIAWGTDTTYATGNAATTEYSTGTDGHQHKYTITGLTPGTKYYYRVTAGSNNWTGNFYAAPAADAANVKFFMYGDTRTNGGSHNAVAGQMVSAYTADPAYQTMVLHAGDWVEGDTEAYWTSQWYNYTWTNIANIGASMPIMGTIGNHEGTSSQPIFEKYHPFPYAAAPANYFSFDYGPVHVAVVDQYTSYTSGSAQYTWLVNDLSASTKPWKIIVLHQPGWCAGGTHGNDTTVQTYIQPLCVTYGVQIVLAGHNHYYSRAVVNGVHHVTSGSGGAPFYSITAGQPYVESAVPNVLECVKVAISGNTLTGTALSSTGSVIDTFTVTLP